MFIKKNRVSVKTLALYNAASRIASKAISEIQFKDGKPSGNEYFNLAIGLTDCEPEIHCSYGVLDSGGCGSTIKNLNDVYGELIDFVWNLYYAGLITVEERFVRTQKLFKKYSPIKKLKG